MTGLGRRLNCALWHGEDGPNDSHDPEPPSKRAKLQEASSLKPAPIPITKVYDQVKIDHTGVTYRRVFKNPVETSSPSDVFERGLTLAAALLPKGVVRTLAPSTPDGCAVFPTSVAIDTSTASSVDTGGVSISPATCNSAPTQESSNALNPFRLLNKDPATD